MQHERTPRLCLGAWLCVLLSVWPFATPATAGEPGDSIERPPASGDDYHTPLAGKPFQTEVFGEHVDVPARDRSSTLAITLGGALFEPPIGDDLVPLGALYYRHLGAERSVRAVLSGLVNEVDYAERIPIPSGLEGIAHFGNDTQPLASTQIVDGREQLSSSVKWGTVTSWLGLGIRQPIAPFEVDNDVRFQAYYHFGYLYTRRSTNTPTGAPLPRDTFVHGFGFRVRADAIERNLLELPHAGWAFGADVILTRRDRSDDPDTRDNMRASGYVVVAFGLPFLSERHRFVFQLHGGYAPLAELDRYSAFRLGGGPPVSEAADLSRVVDSGANFEQFPARRYLVGSLEYRLEVSFFFFLHFRATILYGDVPTTVQSLGEIEFGHERGEAFSVGVTSGFVWDSTIYAEYSYNVGAVRGGDRTGHALLLVWSKGF